MTPSVPVSWGEVIDKITILEIKVAFFTSDAARAKAKHELAFLEAIAKGLDETYPGIAPLKDALKAVNRTLWRIEDDIREKEAKQAFDAEFIALARAVYRNNDERGRLKKEINILVGSEIGEEKQYTAY